jgi:hypothetical protein
MRYDGPCRGPERVSEQWAVALCCQHVFASHLLLRPCLQVMVPKRKAAEAYLAWRARTDLRAPYRCVSFTAVQQLAGELSSMASSRLAGFQYVMVWSLQHFEAVPTQACGHHHLKACTCAYAAVGWPQSSCRELSQVLNLTQMRHPSSCLSTHVLVAVWALSWRVCWQRQSAARR